MNQDGPGEHGERRGKQADLRPVTTANKTAVRVRVMIEATRQRVWRALTKEVGAWWGPPYTGRRARKIVLEPRLGGRLLEEHGPGAGVLWGLVTEIHPERSLTIEGPLGVSGATAGELSLRLRRLDGGRQTSIAARVSITGDVSEGVRGALLQQWEESLGERLSRWIESGEAEGLAAEAFNAPLQRATASERRAAATREERGHGHADQEAP